MNAIVSRASRPSTRGEHLANTLSHGIGLLLAVCALPFLVIDALRGDGGLAVVGATAFGASAILMYLASTLYHAMPRADRHG